MMLRDFSREFVCEDYERSTYKTHVAAPIFRKSFQCKGQVKKAELLICGLGFYELFLNGARVTKGALAPYISNPDHLIYYDYYDITSFLSEGENVMAIMLGDGFQNGKTVTWDFEKNAFNSAPKLALCTRLEDDNGISFFDATGFRCKKGPVLFNDLRSGIFYDKRREDTGWMEPGFCEDGSWHKPYRAEMPRGQAKLCEAEPISVYKELRPVKIFRGELADYETLEDSKMDCAPQEQPPQKTGGWIYDFGENNAGIFRLKIKGKVGQRVDIQCAEIEKEGVLDYSNMFYYPDGYAQRDIYILGSEEEEVFEPIFTYHGFRYLYVSGITEEQATEDLLTYLVMSSDLEERGDFRCSDGRANKIYEIARRSDRSNFYYFPTDCPQREKNGWTGDAVASAEHLMLTLQVEKSLREWLHNIRLAQRENGQIPCICPTGDWGYDWGSGPAWDCVLFTIPYVIYQYRGEKQTIQENADAMLAYLTYISKKRNQKGLVAFGLGDWVPVDKKSHQYDVPLEFSDSVMVYHMCQMAIEMFDAVGLAFSSNFAKQLGAEMYATIRRECIDKDTMTIKGECQSAQAIGIYYDIFEEQEKPEAFRQLLSFIHANNDRIDCGFLGFRVIFHVLARYGETQLAWDMITREEYPSYGWYVENGYTTLPEHFCEKLKLKISCNHHFLGDVVQWFMRYPAGLQIENYNRIRIKPSFLNGLDFAEASHILPSGKASVSWRRFGEVIRVEVVCPKDVGCVFELSDGYSFQGQSERWLPCYEGHTCFDIVNK